MPDTGGALAAPFDPVIAAQEALGSAPVGKYVTSTTAYNTVNATKAPTPQVTDAEPA